MMKHTAHRIARLLAGAALLSAGWLWPIGLAAQEPSDIAPEITLSATRISNGSALLLKIDADDLPTPVTHMRVDFKKTVYRVYPHPMKGNGTYFALIGVPYRARPGAQKLIFKYSDLNGNQMQPLSFKVVMGEYRTDILKVDSRRVNPNPKDRKRANREHQEVKHIYASASPERLWKGPFVLPVDNDISSPFGNRRVFNGKLKSYHNGLDFRSPVGTPIRATNTGIVRVAKNLFYSGNAVIVDHGTEIFSIYAHLSKLKVKAGQRIEKGQLLGLTGATGRVSGPHLHWGIKIKGIAVSPLQFVETLNKGLLQQ
jgi:murein DD-endopeptidase MepM/ murein hydrolase activator NlpD